MDALVKKAGKDFEAALDDDLNMPEALSVIFDFVRQANSIGAGSKALGLLLDFDRVLGLGLGEVGEWKTPGQAEPEIKKLIMEREKERENKNWKEADRIRAELKDMGVAVEDTDKGPRWKRV
jgi:cysteinyl-tRNA synthetase